MVFIYSRDVVLKQGGCTPLGVLTATLVNVHLTRTCPSPLAEKGGLSGNFVKLVFDPILGVIVATLWTLSQLGKTGWNKDVCQNSLVHLIINLFKVHLFHESNRNDSTSALWCNLGSP